MSEREQIVAWLRAESDRAEAEYSEARSLFFSLAADVIERGDDLKEQP